jgi:hypothetical protein
MAGRRFVSLAALVALLGCVGCCRWCERNCCAPCGTQCAPAAYAPNTCCAPAPATSWSSPGTPCPAGCVAR